MREPRCRTNQAVQKAAYLRSAQCDSGVSLTNKQRSHPACGSRVGLARDAAPENDPENIRVNSVAPGAIVDILLDAPYGQGVS